MTTVVRPFVGRERELAELRTGFEATIEGRGGVRLLVGEPGIGKTRTAEELAAWARVRGAHVLWARCDASRGVPAFWPWIQLIQAAVEHYTAPAKSLEAE
jgi:predicted ATPase